MRQPPKREVLLPADSEVNSLHQGIYQRLFSITGLSDQILPRIRKFSEAGI